MTTLMSSALNVLINEPLLPFHFRPLKIMLAKLLVGFAGLLLAVGTNTPQTGAYTTKDGSQCTWFDLRTSQSKISLATACVCKDYKGRPQSYGCQYTGDLYTCNEFKAQTRDILLGLVDQLAGTAT